MMKKNIFAMVMVGLMLVIAFSTISVNAANGTPVTPSGKGKIIVTITNNLPSSEWQYVHVWVLSIGSQTEIPRGVGNSFQVYVSPGSYQVEAQYIVGGPGEGHANYDLISGRFTLISGAVETITFNFPISSSISLPTRDMGDYIIEGASGIQAI